MARALLRAASATRADACLDKLWSLFGRSTGSSDPASASFRTMGGTLQENVFASNPPERNFNAEFLGAATVIPEPSTLVLAGLGRAVGCSGDANDLQLRSRWLPW